MASAPSAIGSKIRTWPGDATATLRVRPGPLHYGADDNATRGSMLKLAVTFLALVASAAAYMALTAAAPVAIPYDSPRHVRAGAAVYAEHCAACHGAQLEGQPDWQNPDDEGYMPAPPQDGSGHTHDHPDVILFNTVKFGPETTVCTDRQSRMGGYADILSDDQIRSVLAYIKSSWPEDLIRKHNRVNGSPD